MIHAQVIDIDCENSELNYFTSIESQLCCLKLCLHNKPEVLKKLREFQFIISKYQWDTVHHHY